MSILAAYLVRYELFVTKCGSGIVSETDRQCQLITAAICSRPEFSSHSVLPPTNGADRLPLKISSVLNRAARAIDSIFDIMGQRIRVAQHHILGGSNGYSERMRA